MITCSFCGTKYNEGEITLFRGETNENILICSDCIDACNTALEDAFDDNVSEENIDDIFGKKGMTPSEMKKHFDDYIINQENAKKKIAVAVYNHYKRCFFNESVGEDHSMKLKKSNLLMVGPSGSGKTLFVETMAKKLDVPYAIADSTSLTASGYVGDDVEIVLKKLIENANGDIDKAQKGIVFLDEIDKIGRKGENPSITRDVGGESVQQALLKMLEGSVVTVPMTGNRKHPSQDCYKIDTSNILFICGGAFEGIEKIIGKRLKKKSKVGFATETQEASTKEESYNELIAQVNAKDLKAFGMTPELLGRLPIICPIEELDREALVKILTEPVDSIVKQFSTLLEMDGIMITFTKECLEAIADKAILSGTGARALRAIMEDLMTDCMFKAPDLKLKSITLTDKCVTEKAEPIYEYIE